MAVSEYGEIIAVLKFLAGYGSFMIALALLLRWYCLRRIWKKMMKLPVTELQDLAMGTDKDMPEWERQIAVKAMVWRNQNQRTK